MGTAILIFAFSRPYGRASDRANSTWELVLLRVCLYLYDSLFKYVFHVLGIGRAMANEPIMVEVRADPPAAVKSTNSLDPAHVRPSKGGLLICCILVLLKSIK